MENARHKSEILRRVGETVLYPRGQFTWEPWLPADDASSICWQRLSSPVGEALTAATAKGVCFLGFTHGDPAFARADLQRRFPGSRLEEAASAHVNAAKTALLHPRQHHPVHLHLKGTDFQLTVWTKLLRVPFGGLITYKALADGSPYARAVGAAVGANPVSWLVPCHRAVRSDGSFDRYYWGPGQKVRLMNYEWGDNY